MLELEDHVQLGRAWVGEQPCLLDGDVRQISPTVSRSASRPANTSARHLAEELVDPRSADVLGGSVAVPASLGSAGPSRRGRFLEKKVDDVDPEAVDPAVEPPAHYLVDLAAHLGFSQLKSGLAFARTGGGSTPRSTRRVPQTDPEKKVAPVVRLGAGAAGLVPGPAPAATSTSPPGVVENSAALHELRGPRRRCGRPPGRGSALHAALVDAGQQLVELGERPEQRVDVRVSRRQPNLSSWRRGRRGRARARRRRAARGGPAVQDPARSPTPSPSPSAKDRG